MVSSKCSMSVLGADAPVSVGPKAMDVRDNQLDKLDSQPLHVSGSGGVRERVLDPSPSDSVLGASTGQAGVPQEEVQDSSPSLSPLSGTESCGTPSWGVSCHVECSAGDSSASIISDSTLSLVNVATKSREIARTKQAGSSAFVFKQVGGQRLVDP